jgi:hypothetical protein
MLDLKVDHIRHDDNYMFFDLCDTELPAGEVPESRGQQHW